MNTHLKCGIGQIDLTADNDKSKPIVTLTHLNIKNYSKFLKKSLPEI